MDILGLIIQFGSGAIGAHLSGLLFKTIRLGAWGSALAGIVGGGVGGQIVERALGLPPVIGSLDVGSIVAQAIGAGVGGGTLMVAVALLHKNFAKPVA